MDCHQSKILAYPRYLSGPLSPIAEETQLGGLDFFTHYGTETVSEPSRCVKCPDEVSSDHTGFMIYRGK
jgi:hypothetical protein